MKSFLVTLLLLTAMLFGIVANSLYINNVVTRMESALEQLPAPDHPDCPAQALALQEYWSKQVKTVDLSVNYLLVDRVSEQVALLSSCAQTGDLYGYYSALALLRDALDDLRHLERLSFGSIL